MDYSDELCEVFRGVQLGEYESVAVVLLASTRQGGLDGALVLRPTMMILMV